MTSLLRADSLATDYGTLTPSGSFYVADGGGRAVQSAKMGPQATLLYILNLYVGLGLLAQAYALQQGGWAALALMVICCLLSCHTGRLVVRCFRRLQEHKGLPEGEVSWAVLADFVWGRRAKWLVYSLAVCELFGAGCMAMMMLCRNLQGLLPHVQRPLIEAATTILLAPCLLFSAGGSNRLLVSVLGVLSKGLLPLLPIVVCLTITPKRFHEAEHVAVRWPTLPMAFAVIMLSYSAHVALPSIYAAMEDPSDFERVLSRAFLVMFLLYATMGALGYLAWGAQCSPVITYDTTAMASAPWQHVFARVVSTVVTASIYATIVPIIGVVSDIVAGACPQRRPSAAVLRVSVLCLTAALCHALDRRLGYVEVALGVLSTAVSLLIPLAMYLRLFGSALGRWSLLGTRTLLAFSVGCVVLVGVAGAGSPTLPARLHAGTRPPHPNTVPLE